MCVKFLFLQLDHRPPPACRGLDRTKQGIVEQELQRLTEARTFGELRERLEDCYFALDNLDIFTAINIAADESPEVRLPVSSCNACTVPCFICCRHICMLSECLNLELAAGTSRHVQCHCHSG